MITFLPEQRILACQRHKQPVALQFSTTKEPVKILVPSRTNPTKLKSKPKKDAEGKEELIERTWCWCPRCNQVLEFTKELSDQLAQSILQLDEEAKAKMANTVAEEIKLAKTPEIKPKQARKKGANGTRA